MTEMLSEEPGVQPLQGSVLEDKNSSVWEPRAFPAPMFFVVAVNEPAGCSSLQKY